MTDWLSRSLREVVDWTKVQHAVGGAALTQPVAAVRAVREAVKIEKTQGIMRVVGDVGRVHSKAGTQAAMDGLKIAQTPRDVSRLARLAEPARPPLRLGVLDGLADRVPRFDLVQER